MQFHLGRLIDHVHINVADLERSATFYAAVLEALGQPPGQLTPDFFQVDELFISPPGPGQALSHVHLAFQAEDHAMVGAFMPRPLPPAAPTMAGRANGRTIRAIMAPLSSTPTATISKPSFTARASARPRR